jgi:hypothetical protein
MVDAQQPASSSQCLTSYMAQLMPSDTLGDRVILPEGFSRNHSCHEFVSPSGSPYDVFLG